MPSDDIVPDFNEGPQEVNVLPLQADQFALSHARAYRAEEERKEKRVAFFGRGEQCSYLDCGEWFDMDA
ncbi:MAG TPA: hypothetical protein PKD12_03240 [Nitrospira sp.]|nr:hypothetical protein [Nitrospira sp.]